MIKRHVIKLGLSLMLLAALASGVVFGTSAHGAAVAPVHPHLACILIIYPPCI